ANQAAVWPAISTASSRHGSTIVSVRRIASPFEPAVGLPASRGHGKPRPACAAAGMSRRIATKRRGEDKVIPSLGTLQWIELTPIKASFIKRLWAEASLA